MEENDRKFFCCPECGARYKVVLDGKKYQCKKCSALFHVADLINLIPIIKPAKRTPVVNKAIKLIPVWVGLFLVVSFIICVNITNKTQKFITPPSLRTNTSPGQTTSIEPESETPVAPRPNPLYEPKLELLSWRWSEANTYLTAEGEVKNISDESMDNIEVIVSFYASNDVFVKSAEALVDYNPIMPGQTSPFKAMTPSNPVIQKARIQFKKMFSGTIPYRYSGN
jgi:hypothetical protein